MEDLWAKWSRFTWSNNRRDEKKVSKRINWVLINSAWDTINQNIQCTNDLAIGSGHTPLILHRTGRGQKRRPHFRFEEKWLENEEYKENIFIAWSEGDRECAPMDICMKLDLCRKRWSMKRFGNNLTELKRAKEKLRRVMQNQLNRHTEMDEMTLKDWIRVLHKREELYWKQKSRVKWLSKGERNSTLFQLTNNARRRRNQITRLQSSCGELVDMEGEWKMRYTSTSNLSLGLKMINLMIRRSWVPFRDKSMRKSTKI